MSFTKEDKEDPGHVTIQLKRSESFFPQGCEAPRPAFTPYEAECWTNYSGNLISHDHHLNQDGEALFRFLLAQASVPPGFLIRCHGSHPETRERIVTTTDAQGHPTTRVETYTEHITDFNFFLDVGRHIASGPIHWSVADSEPAYRGLMVLQVDTPNGRRKAISEEKSMAKDWQKQRYDRGLPPWVGPGWQEGVAGFDDGVVLKSSRSLRQWADEYCASRKLLKDFTYHKVVYGWDIHTILDAIRSTISSTGYHSSVTVEVKVSGTKIHIRPDNKLSRALSHIWVRILLWLFLIYPFIWLFKRFSRWGGGNWEVCGGAYALKSWQRENNYNGYEPVADSSNAAYSGWQGPAPPRLVGLPAGGYMRLVGTREGEWFRMMEPSIRNAVQSRLQTDTPLPSAVTEGFSNPIAPYLDGYAPAYTN
ncbi:hypothetical protein JAAARDRAFT_169544 [Jaapia argillacea MUCL 33604]|uniref:Uncharacterized protein n=1 Tax=Jaapia argillacea MUCL 33604 TaxID=933084 RepID=A0A067QBN6_9AGAM|nr:hypothetical protein JAAARDRAFT_169544 [Jaapia argillacea MUCL 33604]